nr:Glycoside hydrolase domain containing protein [Haemonchus contortus]
MCKFPYSRRRRERLFHQLWVYLLVTCGVMCLILLTLFQEKEKFVLVTETEFPIFDDPFPTTYRPPEQVVGLISDGKRDELSSSIIGPKTDADANILSILPNISLKLDPALIKSSQYHYTNIIVHFDLKGAPPKVGYFLSLLQLVADAGATGILIEWEDMFPWSGELEMVKSTNAYTVAEVQHILKKAQSLGLEVIPLVQTFGHMEWILKYEEFRFLRDDDSYPQVICLGNKKAMNLIKEAIKQVVDMHLPYGIQHFHIGADEAFKGTLYFDIIHDKAHPTAYNLGFSTDDAPWKKEGPVITTSDNGGHVAHELACVAQLVI